MIPPILIVFILCNYDQRGDGFMSAKDKNCPEEHRAVLTGVVQMRERHSHCLNVLPRPLLTTRTYSSLLLHRAVYTYVG